MKQFPITVITCVVLGIVADAKDVDLSLPKYLAVGAASSAYQLEGAWNADGKSENAWDRFTHYNPGAIADRSNGDVACNSYYKYKEDVQLIKSTGMDVYRFSISWARILPTGYTNVINEEGLQYYKNLTRELLANGIEPMVTIYHWDHPQTIEDMGGWMNEHIVDCLVDFARILFETLGGKVKIWGTINEPDIFCQLGYEGAAGSQLAPGKQLFGIGKYICGHNVLKAHARIYHMYNKEFRKTQKGQIGIVLPCTAFIPANSGDTMTVKTAYQFGCGWMAHPIYKGDYPKIMKERIAMISKWQGYSTSRLPEFSDKWIGMIKGSSDYFGLNHYSTSIVSPDPVEKLGIYNSDNGIITTTDPSWPNETAPWLKVYPPGFGDILRWIKDEYNNPPVRVMENGYADYGQLEDYGRVNFHYEYMREMLIAMKRDDCNVKSYCIWSIMDNFEWSNGYTQKFGIIHVDFNHPNRTRTRKLSASWFERVLDTRKLQPVPTENKRGSRNPHSHDRRF